ncbi:MAG: hypothetical protein HZB16_05915 [Armatimonadetes bacterium]|nr:hypothetical protein [Armatimonadota bacterium]
MRPSLLLLVVAGLLGGCAQPEPPIEIGPLPRAASAPKWLPAGWVRYEPRPQVAPERDLVQVYAPDGATAPLVVYCRYTPAEVARLRTRQGADVAGAMLARLRASFLRWPRQAKAAGDWSRDGARRGRWLDVDAVEPEDRSGTLHGRLAVAETGTGAMVVVGVLLPAGGDAALTATVLDAVPLD